MITSTVRPSGTRPPMLTITLPGTLWAPVACSVDIWLHRVTGRGVPPVWVKTCLPLMWWGEIGAVGRAWRSEDGAEEARPWYARSESRSWQERATITLSMRGTLDRAWTPAMCYSTERVWPRIEGRQ